MVAGDKQSKRFSGVGLVPARHMKRSTRLRVKVSNSSLKNSIKAKIQEVTSPSNGHNRTSFSGSSKYSNRRSQDYTASSHGELIELTRLMLTRPSPYPASPLPLFSFTRQESLNKTRGQKMKMLVSKLGAASSLAGYNTSSSASGSNGTSGGISGGHGQAPKGISEIAQCALRLLELLRTTDVDGHEMDLKPWRRSSNNTADHPDDDDDDGNGRSISTNAQPTSTSNTATTATTTTTTARPRRPSLTPLPNFLPTIPSGNNLSANTSTSDITKLAISMDLLLDIQRIIEGLVIGECLYPLPGSTSAAPTALEKRLSRIGGKNANWTLQPWRLQRAVIEMARELSLRNTPNVLDAILPGLLMFEEENKYYLFDYIEYLLDEAQQETQHYATNCVLQQSYDDPNETGITIRLEDTTISSPSSSSSSLSTTNVPNNTLSVNVLNMALLHDYTHSLFQPLLSAILNAIYQTGNQYGQHQLTDNAYLSDAFIQRCHGILARLSHQWSGMPLGLLQVAAQSTDPQVTYGSLDLLQRSWPWAIGHFSVTAPLSANLTMPITNVIEANKRRTDGVTTNNEHHYMPWWFGTGTKKDQPLHACNHCEDQVTGMGAWCTGCLTAVHIECLSYVGLASRSYSYKNSQGKLQTSQIIVCPLPSTDQLYNNNSNSNNNNNNRLDMTRSDDTFTSKHNWTPCHLFTLVVCIDCHRPLWGTSQQGYYCRRCGRCIHVDCHKHGQSSDIEACNASITMHTFTLESGRATLQEELLQQYALSMSKQRNNPTEMAIQYDQLKIQQSILEIGLDMTSIIVVDSNQEDSDDDNNFTTLLDRLIANVTAETNTELDEDEDEDNSSSSSTSILYNHQLLCSITDQLKRRLMVEDISSGLVTPMEADFPVTSYHWLIHAIMRVVSVSTAIAHRLLEQMVLLGKLDAKHLYLVKEAEKDTDSVYYFPLPSQSEHNMYAESLVYTVETCLSDINLSVNEMGLLLLVHTDNHYYGQHPHYNSHTAPQSYNSEFTRRLMSAVLGWVCDESNRLEQLHMELTTIGQRKRSDYGMPQPLQQQQQQQQQQQSTNTTGQLSPDASMGASNYVRCRRQLCKQYVARWMYTNYQRDAKQFSKQVMDCINVWCQQSENAQATLPSQHQHQQSPHQPHQQRNGQALARTLLSYGQRLEILIRMRSNELLFESFETIFTQWIDHSVAQLNAIDGIGWVNHTAASVVPLQRLFGEGRYRRMSNPLMINTSNGQTSFLSLEDWELPLYKGHINDIVTRLAFLQMAGLTLPISVYEWLGKQLTEQQHILSPDNAVHCILFLWRSLLASGDKYVVFQEKILPTYVTALHAGQIAYLRSINEQARTPIKPEHRLLFHGMLTLMLCTCGCVPEEIDALELLPPVQSQCVMPEIRLPEDYGLIQLTDRTPVVQPLLDSIHLTRLDDSFVTIQAMDALIKHGRRIAQLSTFMRSVQPKLLLRTWTAMQTTNPSLIEFILPVFFALINAEHAYFYEFIKQSFWKDWESRYQTLDSAYGLFIKLSPNYVEKFNNDLYHLGFIVSQMIQCLWDTEIVIATKTYQLLDTMPESIRLMTFQCWNDYFIKTDITEQSAICQLMIRVVTSFSNWPVLKWSILLDGLATHLPPIRIGNVSPQQATTNPNEKIADQWTPSDEENITVFLLTLAYRMLARRIPIPAADLYTFKYLTLLQMGFRDCFVRRRTQDVQFGQLEFDPRNLRQRAVIQVCIAGINQLLDIYYISRNGMELRENGDVNDEEVIGTCFIDVLLQLYNSQVDLTQLEDAMLRSWIESIALIVRKCNIKDASRVEELASIVKQLALLLNGPIAADNQILIISTFTLVLQQSPNIIASALWRVVQGVGALLTQLRNHPRSILFTKARYFLVRAIAKFNDSGIFFLIFKNSPSPGHMVETEQIQPEMDMLFVLKTVITDIERHPPEDYEKTIALREKPVHDVLGRIFALKTLEKSGVSRVLYNMSRYIKVTYPLPFCDELASDYINFLNRLARHTTNWDANEFNIIPVLASTAVILQEQLYHYEAMVNAAMTIFRHALQRFELSRSVIISMIHAFNQLLKNLPDYLAQMPDNPFSRCVLVEVEARLNGRSRMLASTATNCIELIMLDMQGLAKRGDELLSKKYLFNFPLTELCRCAAHYLRQPLLLSENESNLRLAVTQLLVFNMEDHGMEVTEFLQENNNVRGALQALCWLCVATLASESVTMYRTLLGAQRVVSLLTLAFSAGHGPEFDSISKLAFIAMKTLSLLYRRITVVPHLRDSNLEAFAEGEETLWQEVWPVLKDQLIILFNPMFQHGAIDSNVEMIWHDFIDMIVFLQRANAHGLHLHAEQWPMLLDKFMERQREQMGAVDAKVSNARRGMDEPPSEQRLDVLLERLLTELIRVSVLTAQPLGKSATSSTTTFAAGSSSSTALSGVAGMPSIMRARSLSNPSNSSDRLATSVFTNLTAPRSTQSRNGIKKPT